MTLRGRDIFEIPVPRSGVEIGDAEFEWRSAAQWAGESGGALIAHESVADLLYEELLAEPLVGVLRDLDEAVLGRHPDGT